MPTLYGLPTCSCVVAWLPPYLQLLTASGIAVRVTQLTGTYGKSGGTHAGGGAIDLIVDNPGKRSMSDAYDLLIKQARKGGADPSWHRPKNWDNAGGIEHAHLTLRGCTHRSVQALAQQAAVDANLNGLANRAADTGYRPLSRRSWATGIPWIQNELKSNDKEGFLMALDDKQQKTLFERVERIDAAIRMGQKGVANDGSVTSVVKNTDRNVAVLLRSLSKGGQLRTMIEAAGGSVDASAVADEIMETLPADIVAALVAKASAKAGK